MWKILSFLNFYKINSARNFLFSYDDLPYKGDTMNAILADANSAGNGSISQTFIMVAIFALFSYFVLWRPDKKRREKMKKLRDSLRKGDKVIAMGIVATVFEIHDRTVILKQYDGSKIEMLKAAISEVDVPASTLKTDH